MPNLVPCEFCEQPIAPNAMRCPHCGGYPTWRRKPQIVVAIIGALIAAGLAAYLAFILVADKAVPVQPKAPPMLPAVEKPAPANAPQPRR